MIREYTVLWQYDDIRASVVLPLVRRAVFRSFLNILIPFLRADPNKAQRTNENTIETRITTNMVPSNFTLAHRSFQSFFNLPLSLTLSFSQSHLQDTGRTIRFHTKPFPLHLPRQIRYCSIEGKPRIIKIYSTMGRVRARYTGVKV